MIGAHFIARRLLESGDYEHRKSWVRPNLALNCNPRDRHNWFATFGFHETISLTQHLIGETI